MVSFSNQLETSDFPILRQEFLPNPTSKHRIFPHLDELYFLTQLETPNSTTLGWFLLLDWNAKTWSFPHLDSFPFPTWLGNLEFSHNLMKFPSHID